MEGGYDKGSILKTHRVYRMGVTKLTSLLCALEAAELQSEGRTKLPPLPQSRVWVGLSGVTRETCSLPLWVQKSL